VAKGRGLPVAEVRPMATGQLYTGCQALNLGLVDRLGGLDKAIDLTVSMAGIRFPELRSKASRLSFLKSY